MRATGGIRVHAVHIADVFNPSTTHKHIPSPTPHHTTVALKPLCADLLGYAPPSSSGHNEGGGGGSGSPYKTKRPMENPFRTVLHVVDSIAARLTRWVLWVCVCVGGWRAQHDGAGLAFIYAMTSSSRQGVPRRGRGRAEEAQGRGGGRGGDRALHDQAPQGRGK